MKKFLIAMLAAAVLMLGCAAGPVVTRTMIPIPARPTFIETMEKNINAADGPASVKIVDWRVDNYTLWLWIDNDLKPLSCDYVAVLEVIDMAREQFRLVDIINTTGHSDPCEYMYGQYDEYLIELDSVEKSQPKGGI